MTALLISAQAAAADGGTGGMIAFGGQIVLILAVFYFFMIRPQQNRAKALRDSLAAMERGDTIVTAGGLIGKVTKLDDTEIEVELSPGTKARVVRATVAEVRSRRTPAND